MYNLNLPINDNSCSDFNFTDFDSAQRIETLKDMTSAVIQVDDKYRSDTKKEKTESELNQEVSAKDS